MGAGPRFNFSRATGGGIVPIRRWTLYTRNTSRSCNRKKKDSPRVVEHPTANLDEDSVTPRVIEEQKSEPRNDPGGDIPLDGFPVPFTPAPVVPEIIEEATFSDEPQPTTSRAIWRRFSNFGMVVVLIGCLLFVLNSVLSNEVIEKIVKLVGSSESLLMAPPVSRSSAVAGTEVVRSELTAQMAGSSLQPSSLETKFPPTQPEALKEPERTFTVSFSSDSDALRSENWNALDSAVVMLGRHPDMIVLIADLSQESLGELYDSDLSSSRIGAVERYLMAAGVNPRRLHVQEHTALKNSDGSAISAIEDTDLLNEILTINLESNRSQ